MARPLSGNFIQGADGSWSVSVPMAQGERARRVERFANRSAAELWVDDVRLAFEAGKPAPAPRVRRLVPHEDAPTDLTPRLTPLDDLFKRHWDEQYHLLRQAGDGRADDVKASYRLHLKPTLHAMGVDCIEQLGRTHVIALVRHLAGRPTEGEDGLEGVWSEKVPPVPAGKDGKPGLLRGSARNVVQVLRSMIRLAIAEGLIDRDPSDGLPMMDPECHEKRKHAQRRLPLPLCVSLAGEMSPSDQVALWIERLAGFRSDEVFSFRVCDVVRKNGRTILRVRDAKSPSGIRDLPISQLLAELLWWFIETVHGPVHIRDQDALLIPTVSGREGAGYATFRRHLIEAGQRLDLASFDDELDAPRQVDLRSHGLRKSLASDLEGIGAHPEATVKRYIGHAAGSTTLARYYILQGLLREFGPIADTVDQMLAEAGISDLRVPTATGLEPWPENPLHARADEINIVLREAGWLVDLTGDDGATWLRGEGVAEQLSVSPRTARRALLAGEIPGEMLGSAGWRVKQSDLDAYLAGMHDTQPLTLDELAARNHLGYHEAYKMLTRLDPGLSDRSGRSLTITEEHERMLANECVRLRDLHTRAVPVAQAALMLRLSVSAITRTWIPEGYVDVDPETDATGLRLVTRASIAKHVGQDGRLSAMKVADAADALRLTIPAVRRLMDAGAIVRTRLGRSSAVTTASVESYGRRQD